MPLVKGEFGVRWKFRKVKSQRENGKERLKKGKGRAEDGNADTDDDEEHDHADPDHIGAENSGDEGASNHSHGHLDVPSVVVSDGHQSSSTSTSSTRPVSPNPYAQYLTSDWVPQSFLQHSHSHQNAQSPRPEGMASRSLSSTTPRDSYAPARGMTPYLKLQEHNVVFEHTLDVVVQMAVHRDTLDLLPNELKLVVMQVCRRFLGYYIFPLFSRS